MQSERRCVLDHGFIRLIDSMGSDLSVVRAARVSHDAAWRAGDDTGSDARLIHRLWRDKHTSPFEAVQFTFEVYAPIFVFRQWHRHRTQSYSEKSGRYSKMKEQFYTPDPATIGRQHQHNKQMRTDDQIPENLAKAMIGSIKGQCAENFETYRRLLEAGCPRELARTVLPLATYSHMFVSMNLLNLFRFLTLRLAPDAQYEIRVYAKAMRDLIRPIVPVCVEAFESCASI